MIALTRKFNGEMKPRTQAQAFFLTFPKNLKPVETDEVISKED